MLTRITFDRITPVYFTIWPPIKARTIRTRRANTVPPGAAIGPRMVQAARKMAAVVVRRVREWAQGPWGGQHFDLEAEASWRERTAAVWGGGPGGEGEAR